MEVLRKMARRLARPLHVALRSQKVKSILELVEPGRCERLLDVGGGIGVAGEFARLYERFENVTVLNLDPGSASWGSNVHATKIRADGCKLPFSTRSIDWVFSNAVIEHVGGWSKQQQFANEIRRVAMKGYFVTTPNRYFPIEPHTLLPFYQFLSPSWQGRIVRFSPGYLQDWEEINLLSAKQMRVLFPEARVYACGLPVLANSLVACYRVPKT